MRCSVCEEVEMRNSFCYAGFRDVRSIDPDCRVGQVFVIECQPDSPNIRRDGVIGILETSSKLKKGDFWSAHFTVTSLSLTQSCQRTDCVFHLLFISYS